MHMMGTVVAVRGGGAGGVLLRYHVDGPLSAAADEAIAAATAADDAAAALATTTKSCDAVTSAMSSVTPARPWTATSRLCVFERLASTVQGHVSPAMTSRDDFAAQVAAWMCQARRVICPTPDATVTVAGAALTDAVEAAA